MMSVDRHIAYLVTRHDCVIVPGFGAFVSLYQSAAYDSVSDTFTPPCRRLGFNPDIAHADAMIAASMARRESISYDRAVEMITSRVSSWRRQLDSGRNVTIDGLGEFARNSNGHLIFTPSCHSVANAPYAGLPALLPHAATGAEEPSSGQGQTENHPRIRRLSASAIRAAASAAIIISVAATMFTAVLRPESPLYYASLFPSVSTSRPVDDRPIEHPYGSELRIAMVPAATGSQPHMEPLPAKPEHRYFLVVASLASEAEASRYLAAIPAERRALLNILPGEGRYRIYAASGASFAEANNERFSAGFKESYPDAWVYVKR